MGNYRTKMRQLGRLDVTVNGGKRGSDTTNGEPPKTQIKKPKKGEINFLPDFPEGMNDQNMEVAREVLVNEMMKTKPKESLVKKEMDVTFAFRRKEIVKEKPAISQLVHRWPALFTENQVSYEFGRVVGKNLRENFLDALDHLSPSLMDLFKKKKGLTGQLLAERLCQTKGLPVILGDDPSAFFKTCFDTADNDLYRQTPVGLLFIGEENLKLNPSKVGIILEGNVVMDDLANLPQAFCVLLD
ncbi:uncharacterized protein LOC124390047 [Silurus meridionalis]|uniref:uncharacterized protein LOC124390047 n=1 Tax=Silurus meridionalis TaxID=175797 RepID=UPI001EEA7355|nr:uncharacterized protein LOC124390047 [Silurus meridionalis]